MKPPKNKSLMAKGTSPSAPEISACKNEMKVRLVKSKETSWGEQILSAKYGATANGVVGLGFGVKLTENHVANLNCLRIYVKRKRLRRNLTRAQRIPEFVNGIPTDVIEMTSVIAQSVRCGVSVSHPKVTSGTLGCLVERDGRRYILSNNHVIANCNRAKIGDDIWQPGTANGGKAPAIARLTESVDLDFRGYPNLFDAAIAELIDPSSVSSSIEVIGRVASPPLLPEEMTPVKKFGSASQLTEGVIHGKSEDIALYYPGRGRAIFANQICVNGAQGAFSIPGDSGALLVESESTRPVGLLVGAGRNSRTREVVSFSSPIGLILDQFEVSIVVT